MHLMKTSFLLKKCEAYYKLCKLAGLIKFPQAMYEEILNITSNTFYRIVKDIFEKLYMFFDKVEIGFDSKIQSEKDKTKIEQLVAEKNKISNINNICKNVTQQADSLINPSIGSDLNQNSIFLDLIDLDEEIPTLEKIKYQTELMLFYLEIFDVKVDLSDLSEGYLRENSRTKEENYFNNLKLKIIVNPSGNVQPTTTLGGFDLKTGYILINITNQIKDIINQVFDNKQPEISSALGSKPSEVIQHELRHLVQNFIDWKTGKRKFNSKGQLCEVDNSGNPIVDSSGNCISRSPNEETWAGQKELSESSEAIIGDNLTLAKVKNEEAKNLIKNFLSAFNLPDDTIINSKMLLDISKQIDRNDQSSEMMNKKNSINMIIDLMDQSGKNQSIVKYLLSPVEYETWLADSVNEFYYFIEKYNLPYNKDSFEKFIGHQKNDDQSKYESNIFLSNLYYYDSERWKKAVGVLWTQINNKLSLNWKDDFKASFNKYLTKYKMPNTKASLDAYLASESYFGKKLEEIKAKNKNFYISLLQELNLFLGL